MARHGRRHPLRPLVQRQSSLRTAFVGGTAGDGLTEAQVVAGGETIIVTLSNDTWVASGATFDAQRQAILDGLDSAQSEADGWNARVRDAESVTAVVRTSDTVVTITLSAAALYAITADETVTVTVPGSAVASGQAITGWPTFTVANQAAAGGTGKFLLLLGVG
jgi:hypothetical protein